MKLPLISRRLAGIFAGAMVAIALMLASSPDCSAQRRVTPVKSGSTRLTGVNENRQPGDSIDRSKLVETIDDQGNKVLVDTVTGKEVADTVPEGAPLGRVPKMLNPLVYSAAVGVDIWDPLMRIFGQSFGVVGFSAEFNMHNRYIPVVEVGLGSADSTPGGQNYTYHSGLTPYFRIGMNYNFLYNSNPDYQFVAGIRYGWSRFSYQLRDVEISDPYWGETATVDFPSQTSSVSYLNVLFGLRVRVFGPVSMGWDVRFRAILHETKQPDGKPWYIPGYGSRSGIITASFSVFYNFSLAGKKKKEPALPAGFEELPDGFEELPAGSPAHLGHRHAPLPADGPMHPTEGPALTPAAVPASAGAEIPEADVPAGAGDAGGNDVPAEASAGNPPSNNLKTNETNDENSSMQ